MDTTEQTNRTFSTVLTDRHHLEAPRWRAGRIYASDMYGDAVYAVAPGGASELVASVPGQASGIGWLPDGTMLVVSMQRRVILRQEASGELTVHADLSGLMAADLNDMVVSPSGHAYVGGLGFELNPAATIQPSPVYHVSPDGQVTAFGENIRCPNGLTILPDGRTLVVAETFGARLTAFDIAPDGSLSNQRSWADFGAPESDTVGEHLQAGPVAPDGLCSDAEGAVWVADVLGQRALRLEEGGRVLDTVASEILAIAPALGGEDGHTLFLCMSPTFAPDELKAARGSKLVSTRVPVPAPRPAGSSQ